MTTYLVGERPTAETLDAPLHPDRCRGGSRLRELSGLTHYEFMARFVRVNIFGLGEPFSAPVGRQRAADILDNAADGASFVLLGVEASLAFGLMPDRTPEMRWLDLDCGYAVRLRHGRHRMTITVPLLEKPWRVARMPHPSGRCRWWNDPDNRRRAEEFMRALP